MFLYVLPLLLLGPGDDLKIDAAPPAGTAAATAPAVPAKGDDTKPAGTTSNEDAKKGEAPAATSEKNVEADEKDKAGAPAASPVWDVLSDIMKSGAMGYMIEGGFFMWPILFCGILATGVIIERYRSLKMLTTDSSKLRVQVRDLLQADRVEEALQLCDREQGPVAAVLSAGLRKYLLLRKLGYDPGQIEGQVVKGMDDYGVHIVAALERHLPILATIASVAPMLGFLGTVQGMVVSFDDIVRQMGKMNIVEAAAGGIKVSLLTTVLGLVVGIPAFTAFNYFTSVINRFVLEVSESASELIETVTLQLAMRKKD